MKLQDPYSAMCAPTAIYNIVNQHVGRVVSLEEIAKACGHHKLRGTPIEGIYACFDTFGFKLTRLQFDVRGICAALRRSKAVVSLYWTDQKEAHFTEIAWARTERKIDYVTLNDPLYGDITFPLTVYKLLWRPEGSWARQVVRK